MRRRIIIAVLVSVAVLSLLLASVAGASPSQEPFPQRYHSRMEDFRYELHWGFVFELGPATPDSTLMLPMDGRIQIDDGDSDTREGVHIIGAQLFEADGTYEEGHRDRVITPPRDTAFREAGGVFYPWVAWQSSTTDDWDGMAVRFRYEAGTDPLITIETGDWSAAMPASELRELSQVVPLIEEEQELEMGPFFTLAYRLYDMDLYWGYEPEHETGLPADHELQVWDGGLSISDGGIRIMGARNMESGGSRERGMDDEVLQEADLSSGIEWRSTTLDVSFRRAATDGLAVTFVVPREASDVTINGTFGETTLSEVLPEHWRDAERIVPVDDEDHFVHGHLHWCWFKTPNGHYGGGHGGHKHGQE
ncbi:MAG: hypothetical protein ACE5HA_00005 [Anaerolineae bacterium]